MCIQAWLSLTSLCSITSDQSSPFCRVTFLPDDAKPLSNIGVMIGECGSEKLKWTTPQTPEAPTGLNCHLLGRLVPKHLRARFPRPDSGGESPPTTLFYILLLHLR